MKARNNPTDRQLLRRQRGEPIGPHDPRARNDAYWALRHQGYSHAFARRALRDSLPRYYRERMELSGEYIDDIGTEDLLFVPKAGVDLPKLAVLVRPDLSDEIPATAPPRSTEYTIWSEAVPGLGLRVRPSGVRTYIVMFRINGRGNPCKITLGKAGDLSFDLAKRLARQVRLEARTGKDPRPMQKSGELLRRIL